MIRLKRESRARLGDNGELPWITRQQHIYLALQQIVSVMLVQNTTLSSKQVNYFCGNYIFKVPITRFLIFLFVFR